MSSGASRVKISTASWSARKSEPLTVSKAWLSERVVADVAERGVDPALGGAGVAARRVELRDDGDVGAGVERLDRGAHPGAPGADHEYVVRRLHAPDATRTHPPPARESPAAAARRRLPPGRRARTLEVRRGTSGRAPAAFASYASGSRQVERGSSSAGSTPGTATGTLEPEHVVDAEARPRRARPDERGVQERARRGDRHPMPASPAGPPGPAGVHEPHARVVLGELLAEEVGVDRGRLRQERAAEARREHRCGLGDTDLGAGESRREAGEEVVARLGSSTAARSAA